MKRDRLGKRRVVRDRGLDRLEPRMLLAGSPPDLGTISINDDDATTTSLVVSLDNLGATDPDGDLADMRFSNDNATWSDWEAFATSRAGWNLSSFGGSSSIGSKTVYVQYRDLESNVSSSFSDDIAYSPLPVVTIAATDASAAEAGLATGVFTITRTVNTNGALTVLYSVSGTAAEGSDFDILAGSADFADGQATATITITPTDDSIVESSETVLLELFADAAYDIGSPSSATVTIADNDVQSLVVTPTTLSVGEGSSDTFLVTLAREPSSVLTITVNGAVGATSDTDLTADSPSFTLDPLNWDTGQVVTLSAADDADSTNGSRVFTIASAGLTSRTVTVTEADDDTSATGDAYEENDSTAQVDAAPAGQGNSPNLGQVAGTRTISGLDTMDDDTDFFKITLAADGTSADYVRITFDTAVADLDLFLFESDGTTQIDSSEGTTNTEQVSLDGLAAGTYYIQVLAYEAAQSPDYTLTIKAPVPPIPARELDGLTSSMRYDSSGTLHVAWQDSATLTLKYATRSDDGTWSDIVQIDATPKTGKWLSLAIDKAGLPGIAYYDGTNLDLKYAHFNGSSWDVSTVDSANDVGRYCSLAYISNSPAIAYHHKTAADLKLATWSGSVWKYKVVDATGNAGLYASLALNPKTKLWAIAYMEGNKGLIRFAQNTSTGWQLATVEDMRGSGGYTSLAFDRSYQPAISYYDSLVRDLKFGHYFNSKWNITTVATTGVQGLYTTLRFSAANKAEIVHYSKDANKVFLATGKIGAWTLSTLKTGGGTYVSTAVNAANDRSLGWLQTSSGKLIVDDV